MSEGFEYSQIEQNLVNKYSLLQLPINIGFELTPYCNFNCKMCYIHDAHLKASVLNKDQWINIAKQARNLGVLFILLTGGEPLLHPQFKEIYTELKNMGMILTINTNGTLINEEMAQFLSSNPPRRINLSLYGTTNEIYNNLCEKPHGFDEVKQSLELLLKYHIPVKINIIANTLNYHNLDDMFTFCKHYHLDVELNSYLYEPIRKNNNEKQLYRLSPQDMALANIKWYEYRYSLEQMMAQCVVAYESLSQYKQPTTNELIPLQCRAGTSSAWVCFNGDMIPCVNIPTSKVSLFDHSLKEAWDIILKDTSQIKVSRKCLECSLKKFCQSCGAIAYHENQTFEKVPDIMCETTYYQVKQMASRINKERKM